MARFTRTQADDLDAHITDEVATVNEQSAEVAAYPDEVLAQVRELVAQLPSEGGGDGGEAIVTALLAATSVDDLNAPWDGTSGRALAGKRVEITGITARPSSFEGGSGVFLLVQGTDTKTGERATFTTSSIATVLQLAMAWKLGMFPLIADIVVAERPTARGFYPYHLRVIAAGRKAQA